MANSALLGRTPLVSAELTLPPITRRSRSTEVARRALAVSVANVVRALARVLVEEDPEWIHQARSASRALRANLLAFSPLFDRKESELLDGRLRELAASLGAVRDNDVLIGNLHSLGKRLPVLDGPAIDSLVARCRSVREQAYSNLLAQLRDDTYPRLLEDLVRSVCRDSPLIVYPDGIHRRSLVRDVASEPWRRLRKAVRICGTDPTPEQLHAVRIKAKRCRYAVEAIIPLVPKSRLAAAKRFLRRLGQLQETLGTFHDAVSESERLRELTASKLDRFVAGEVAGLDAQIAADARGSWRKAWKKASRRDAHFWRKSAQ